MHHPLFELHTATISDGVYDLASLSDDERARAARYAFESARRQFVVARGFLRRTLAAYLHIDPAQITFRYGKRGKLSIDGVAVRFNLTHSGDLILLAVTQGREIGVDVEQRRPLPHLHTMATDHFSEREQNALFALPPAQQLDAFFHIWTRKEAYIKAVGDGFALPLQAFDVTHDNPPQLHRAGDQWRLHHIDPATSYIGAVCIGK
jgi:4'-phosphopantetheinyl transferase